MAPFTVQGGGTEYLIAGGCRQALTLQPRLVGQGFGFLSPKREVLAYIETIMICTDSELQCECPSCGAAAFLHAVVPTSDNINYDARFIARLMAHLRCPASLPFQEDHSNYAVGTWQESSSIASDAHG